jgi:uncharacterized repeat protein (TIGR01451 family)
MKTKFTYLLLWLLLGATTTLVAQAEGKIALDYLQKEYASFGLEATDVDALRITDNYLSPSGTRHIYVAQQLHGLPILNAQASLHFRGDKLVHRTNGLATGLAAVPSPAPALSAQTAIGKAVNAVTTALGNPIVAGTDGKDALFNWPAVSPEPIRVRSGYYVTKVGPRLAYRVVIDRHASASDIWYMVVDAENGNILQKANQVLKCDFGSPNHQHNYDNACENVTTKALPVSEQIFESVVAEESSYLVFPLGVESPIHGERRLEKSPWDAEASPFGWHDTNGEDGPEFTITRGNNSWSYPDRNGDDNPDTDVTAEGGDTLSFIEYYEVDGASDSILKAALVQTFYITSILHDWLYHAGFDEAAGNFQRKNYSETGRERDEVRVEVQDGSGNNNANFFTPADGSSGIMQMFLWSDDEIDVLSPASLAGVLSVGNAEFGRAVGLTAKVVPAMDASANANEGCGQLVNPEMLVNNIALINRGTCFFEEKAFNAQEAGAVGVIICNNVADPVTIDMAEPDDPDLFDVSIPSIMLSMADCALLRIEIENGEEVRVTFRSRDGDFDNGIVAHELGHGFSNRLVGGPNNTGCLRNNEQMGEGWSDFFALASSPQTNTLTPDGTEPRGIGNFVLRNDILGRGIRQQPYSTDMSVNNHTYDDVIVSGTAVHFLGEVWATMLWDLYWAMTEEHGFDPDLINGTGGNNDAVRLVTEGMKYTACGPGFVDGRDGILVADLELNDGANQCLIWEVFARRGVGFSARQGSGNDRTDNFEAFDVDPACSGTILFSKSTNVDVIDAGDVVTFTLVAENYRGEEVENVIINDVLPEGMLLEMGSVEGVDSFEVDGANIRFYLGTMANEDDEIIRYTVSTDPTFGSIQTYYDADDEGDRDWLILNLLDDPGDEDFFWERVDTTPYAGDLAWYIVNSSFVQDQSLETADPLQISGDRPILRFFTKYETEPTYDAGIIEISTDEVNWTKVNGNFLRGGYRGGVNAGSAAPLLNGDSFWGPSDRSLDAESNGYREILLDMSDYSGQEVSIRFRFISDAAESARGWWVDEIELLDAKNYESTATLTSDAGDNVTAEVGNYGVLVLNAVIDDVNDPALGETKVSVFPNPAEDFVTVDVTTERAGSATVQLLTIDGRVLRTEQLSLIAGGGRTTINTTDLPTGIYVVQVTGANRVSTTKVTIN